MSALIDFLFPGRARQVAELQAQRIENARRAKLDDMYEKVASREIAILEAGEPLPMHADRLQKSISESTDNVSMQNPWWVNIANMSLDQAWRAGFPTPEQAYGFDDAAVANSDTFRNTVLQICRILYATHPHAKGLINTAVAFVVGSKGWTVEPAPKVCNGKDSRIEPLSEADDPDAIQPVGDEIAPVPDQTMLKGDPFEVKKPLSDKQDLDHALARKIRKLWKKYCRRGHIHPLLGWKQFWREAYLRARRDGECFIYLANAEDDGRLSPRFIDPLDIVAPYHSTASTTLFDPDANGIRVKRDDPTTVEGYWFMRRDLMEVTPRLIPAEHMIHVKYGVDSSIKRGLPALFVVREHLRQFDQWVAQALKHQRVQSSVAILRSWTNSSEAMVTQALGATKTRETTQGTPAGTSLTRTTQSMMPVLDAPAGMTLDMKSPQGNFGDSEILARRVLLAVAVGTSQSEAMVTGDGSNANYASTRITQLFPLRAMADEQGDWCDTLTFFYERWCGCEAMMKRLPPMIDDEMQDCNVQPDALPNFEAEIVSTWVAQMVQLGIMSIKTGQEKVGLDPVIEEERLKEEHEKLNEQSTAAEGALRGEDPTSDGEEPEADDEDGGQDDQEDPDADPKKQIALVKAKAVMPGASPKTPPVGAPK